METSDWDLTFLYIQVQSEGGLAVAGKRKNLVIINVVFLLLLFQKVS